MGGDGCRILASSKDMLEDQVAGLVKRGDLFFSEEKEPFVLDYRSAHGRSSSSGAAVKRSIDGAPKENTEHATDGEWAIAEYTGAGKRQENTSSKGVSFSGMGTSSSLMRHSNAGDRNKAKPRWHPPWELGAVISGHVGWVRAIAVDPSNEWFVTGSADRTIKIWDLAKACTASEGSLKLTLTGHVDTIRALAVSSRHPYLFSAAEDKQVKCWDLESNKVVRHYHGHLSGVHSLALHPTLDILVTGGRDSAARVWDMRSRAEIHVLTGHKDSVSSILTNSVDPQVITASHDSTIKLWDLAAGKCMTTLTHHKKGVRALAACPREATFVSASADCLKKWQLRDGKFLKNFTGHDAIVNTVAINDDEVCISGGDDGSMRFWDTSSGHLFQREQAVPQPGSLDAEAGIFASCFDLSGSRYISCEADKSIKIWKEDEAAVEDVTED